MLSAANTKEEDMIVDYFQSHMPQIFVVAMIHLGKITPRKSMRNHLLSYGKGDASHMKKGMCRKGWQSASRSHFTAFADYQTIERKKWGNVLNVRSGFTSRAFQYQRRCLKKWFQNGTVLNFLKNPFYIHELNNRFIPIY